MSDNDERFDFAEFFGYGKDSSQESCKNSTFNDDEQLCDNCLRDEKISEFTPSEKLNEKQINDKCVFNDEIVTLSGDSTEASARKLARESSDSIYGRGVNIAVENDWLELTCASGPSDIENSDEEDVKETKFEENTNVFNEKSEDSANKSSKNVEKLGKKLGRKGMIAAALAVIVIIAAVCAFSFGGADVTEWWTSVKKEALGVFGVKTTENIMVVSAISTVGSVSCGDIVVRGGTLAVTFSAGKVRNVTNSSVSLEYDENTEIIFNALKDVKVVSGQVLSRFDILGYYDEAYTVNIYFKGKKVENVALIGNSIVWEV